VVDDVRGTPEPVPGQRETPQDQPARRPIGVRLGGLLIAVAVLGFVCILSLAVGARSIPIGTTWHVLWDNDGSSAASIIHTLRIPRTLIALMIGVALGLSGAVMQALTLNPLAEPGLLGVNLGASTGVVIALAYFGVVTFAGYVWFAFAGAAITSVAVFMLGNTGRTTNPERQVLAGVGLTAVLGAFVYGILALEPDVFDRYRFWDVGSFSDLSQPAGRQLVPFIVAGTLIALGIGPALNALAMGEETGRALGAHVLRTRALGMLSITLLCGAATAVAGPIWFVGLAVPHIARIICGPDQRWILAYSMVLAPALLLAADCVGRVVAAPSELQVGIVTAFLGAPVFIWLARKRRAGES